MTPMIHPASRPSHGRSLIELMIAILIGSIVLIGVLVITVGSSTVGRRSDAQGSLTDTGQVALQLLGTDVRMAGYSEPRTIFVAGYVTKMMPFAGIRGCDNGFAVPTASTAALACGGSANSAFSVVYEADNFNSVLVTGGVPSDCRGTGLVSMIAGGTGNEARPANTEDIMSNSTAYWRVENRYYIGTSNGEPTLMCMGSGGNPQFTGAPVPLVRGVERMVVTYGVAPGVIDPSKNDQIVAVQPNVTSFMTAAQIDSNVAWVGEPTNVRWQRVVSVRICLETVGDAKSADTGFAYRDCTGALVTPTDGRARRAVFATMNLRNRTNIQNGVIGIGGV